MARRPPDVLSCISVGMSANGHRDCRTAQKLHVRPPVNKKLAARTHLVLCRGFFGKQGSFTSFFSRTGGSGVAAPGGEASIHGGAAGGFRQVRDTVMLYRLTDWQPQCSPYLRQLVCEP